MKTTRTLVFMSLFIALQVILTRFLSIQTPILRIGFSFIPISLCSIVLGPALGGITAGISDIVGMMIFPHGAYFPGFTLSALLSGAIYGLGLYKKPNTIIRVAISVLLVTIIVDLGLNTLWLSMITGKAAIVLIYPRLIKSAIMMPIQISLIYLISKYTYSYFKLFYAHKV